MSNERTVVDRVELVSWAMIILLTIEKKELGQYAHGILSLRRYLKRVAQATTSGPSL